MVASWRQAWAAVAEHGDRVWQDKSGLSEKIRKSLLRLPTLWIYYPVVGGSPSSRSTRLLPGGWQGHWLEPCSVQILIFCLPCRYFPRLVLESELLSFQFEIASNVARRLVGATSLCLRTNVLFGIAHCGIAHCGIAHCDHAKLDATQMSPSSPCRGTDRVGWRVHDTTCWRVHNTTQRVGRGAGG